MPLLRVPCSSANEATRVQTESGRIAKLKEQLEAVMANAMPMCYLSGKYRMLSMRRYKGSPWVENGEESYRVEK